MAYEFKLPDLGEGVHEGEIVQWLVKVGDRIRADQPVVEVMTDKVTSELPIPVGGVVARLGGQAGEVIPVGAVLLEIDTEAPAPTAELEAAPESPAPDVQTAPESAAEPAGAAGEGRARAVPAVRKLARELGVDL
ncbi:MAG: biotin/lipoyl-containing protein, partial [Actinomycetota bacterium]